MRLISGASSPIVFLALASAILPVAISYELSRRMSLAHQRQELLATASDLLRRSGETGTQLWVAREALKTGRYGPPGSASEIRQMRYLTLTSTYLQAVGRMVGTKVLCSSMGRVDPPEDLGPPDIVTINNVRMWLDAKLNFGGGATFHAVESEGCVVFIAPDLLFDLYIEEPNVSLGLLTGTARLVIEKKGYIDPDWLKELKGRKTAVFQRGPLQVALRRGEDQDIVAVAAQPVADAYATLGNTFWINLLIGAAVGLGFALLILRKLVRFEMLPYLLRAAMRNREFFLEYQPVVDLQSGQWVGAEALIRWRRPTGEVVRPDVFIQAAEDMNMIQELTAMVLETALADLSLINAVHPTFYVAINVSSSDIHSGQLPELIVAQAKAKNISLANVGIEVTESGLLTEDAALPVLASLRRAGVRVLMDDFGTGYSSLAYLMRLDVDVLKIDKLFVAAIGTESVTSNVVNRMIQMARDLEKDVIAEGVETDEQAGFLLDLGVKHAQGYYFAVPMPIGELVSSLSKA